MKVFSIKLGRSTIMILALLLSFLLLSPSESASAACSKDWDPEAGTGTSDWNTASNWAPSGVPGAADDVCIFAGASPDPIISSTPDSSINSLTIPGGETLKINSGTLTVTGNVTINGTLNNQGTLNVGGNFTNNSTYTEQASGTVVMNGTAVQSIGGGVETSFNNLGINNAAGVTLGTNAGVNGVLTLTSGTLTLASNRLTMGTSATVGGSPSASNMIDASGSGAVRKEFGATGSFLYPVGTPGEYSPIEVNITAGSFASNEYVDARVTNSAESHVNTSGASYINRHWILSDSGISGLSANLTMTYLAGDVVGTGTLAGGFYDTSANQWVVNSLRASSLGGGTVSVTTPTLTGNATGGTTDALAVQMAFFSAIFTGEDVQVEWGTISELNNLGFNLYRSTSADSLGTKINSGMIASQAPGSGQGSLYEYRDSSVESGVTYFYTLEDLDVNGATSRYGPVSVETSHIATAVTLEEIGTSSTSQSGALYLLLGSVLLAGAGFTLYRTHRA